MAVQHETLTFRCFPRKQGTHLVYSSWSGFRSALFRSLTIQTSPKNSLPYRILKSPVGYLINSLSRQTILVPDAKKHYIGIVKKTGTVMFELLDGIPKKVWRIEGESRWKSELFLGYSIIREYSTSEFHARRGVIHQALNEHWKQLKAEPTAMHGDLTHFNILVDSKEKIHFIDSIEMNLEQPGNPPVYDLFYFHAYFKQSLLRCRSLNQRDRNEVISGLEIILKKILQTDVTPELSDQIKRIKRPSHSGISSSNEAVFLEEFISLVSGFE